MAIKVGVNASFAQLGAWTSAEANARPTRPAHVSSAAGSIWAGRLVGRLPELSGGQSARLNKMLIESQVVE